MGVSWVLWAVLCGAVEVLQAIDDLAAYRESHVGTDYLLLKSGADCARCADIEKTMFSINQHTDVPVLVARYEDNELPELELHEYAEELETHYRSIPYNGRLTLSSILSFMQQVYRTGLQKCLNKDHCERKISKLSGDVVGFLGRFSDEDSEALATYNKAMRAVKKEMGQHAQYFYYVEASDAPDTVSVKHESEMRLATRISTVDQLIQWMRVERKPIFGPISSQRVFAWDKDTTQWVVLLGSESTYDLYEHELRHFGMKARDDWAVGFLPIGELEAIAFALRVSPEEIESLLKDQCPSGECVAIRRDSVLLFINQNIASESIQAAVAKITGPTLSTSRTADLKVDNEKLEEIKPIESREAFSGIFANEMAPALLLVYDPEDAGASQELKSIYQNVARRLGSRLRYYDLSARLLPLPDSRYNPPQVPWLWLKPSGAGAQPIEVPWQEDLVSSTMQAVSEQNVATERYGARQFVRYLWDILKLHVLAVRHSVARTAKAYCKTLLRKLAIYLSSEGD